MSDGNGELVALGSQIEYAKAMASADIIPDSYRGRPANILVAMGFGRSMGLSPAESLYRINVIKGKPTMSAELIAAQVRRSGHKLWYEKDEQNLSVTAFIQRKDDPEHEFHVTRDKQWAHNMGLDKPDRKGNPSNYQKQPMTMLTWRATTAVAREACPEALFGVAYTPDEMHDSEFTEPVAVVQDDPPQQDTASQSEAKPVEAEVLLSKPQKERIISLMRQNGVTDQRLAGDVLFKLTGRIIDKVGLVTQEEADLLLSNEEHLANTIKSVVYERKAQQ